MTDSSTVRRRAVLSTVVLAALTGCLGSLPLDRKKAADYQRRYMMDCRREPTTLPAAAHDPDQVGDGSLSKALIGQLIQARLGEVQACYDEALAAWPELHGRVEVKFVIAPDGSAANAIPLTNSSGVPALGCCITHAVRAWRFPPPDDGGIVIVQYPFVLQLRP